MEIFGRETPLSQTNFFADLTHVNFFDEVEKINPDLDAYVTQLAIEGLFKLVEKEENKIRKDPGARVTDLLMKVFSSI